MTEELAWAAGFFDGEGNAVLQKQMESVRRSCRMQLPQVERGILERFRDAVGYGRVYGPYGPYRQYAHGRNAQPIYQWNVTALVPTWNVALKLWPWLGETKRDQISKMFADYYLQPAPMSHADRVALAVAARRANRLV